MDAKVIAFCGIDCSACDAYRATQSGDPAELDRVATAWRALDPNVTTDTLLRRPSRGHRPPVQLVR